MRIANIAPFGYNPTVMDKHPSALAPLTLGQNWEVQHYPKAVLVQVVLLPKLGHLGLVEWWVDGFALIPQRVVLVRYESPAYFVPLPEGQVQSTIVVIWRVLGGQPPEVAAEENSVSM